MRHLLNLPIKLKLALGFGVVGVFLVLVAGIAIVAMTELRDAQIEIQEIHLANVIDYQALDANLSKNRVLLNRMMRSRDHSRQDELQRSIGSQIASNTESRTQLLQQIDFLRTQGNLQEELENLEKGDSRFSPEKAVLKIPTEICN